MPEDSRRYVLTGDDLEVELRRSYQRCKECGVDPNITSFSRCRVEEIESVKRSSITTYAYSNRVIKTSMENVHDAYLGIAVFDQNGWLIRLYGKQPFREWALKRGIVPFSNWSERSSGTNAISLGMRLNSSLELFGTQNYCRILQDTAIYFTPYVIDVGKTFGEHRYEKHGGVAVITPLREHPEDFLITTSAIGKEVCLHLHMVDSFNGFFNTETSGHISIDIDMETQTTHLLYHSANIFKILGITQRNLHFENVDTVFDLPPKNEEFWNIINEGIQVQDRNITLSIQGREREFNIRTLPFKQTFLGFQGVHVFLQSKKLTATSVSINAGNIAQMTFRDIVGKSEIMKHTIHQANILSKSDWTLLLLGESGVGKDVFARAIHSASSRSQRPFVSLNCAAIPRELIASELFGYMEGAFTGAKKGGNMGKFELADSGTIFLDEIGDMPLDLQAALLDVIEKKSFMRVGGPTPKMVDVRVIAATNTNLLEKIEKKQFREDLYYRLSAVQLIIPPLRDRGQDVVLLAEHFIDTLSEKELGGRRPVLSPEAKQLLISLPWRGNVRELRNVITGVVSLYNQPVIEVEHIRDYVSSSRLYMDKFPQPDDLMLTMEMPQFKNKKITREGLKNALEKNRYNKAATAEQLGISRKTLYRWMAQFGLT